MTEPAQDPQSFDLSPNTLIAALTAQRNEAMDEAARWRAVALSERETTIALRAEAAKPNRAARRAKTEP